LAFCSEAPGLFSGCAVQNENEDWRLTFQFSCG
jgi:hypothetical protein